MRLTFATFAAVVGLLVVPAITLGQSMMGGGMGGMGGGSLGMGGVGGAGSGAGGLMGVTSSTQNFMKPQYNQPLQTQFVGVNLQSPTAGGFVGAAQLSGVTGAGGGLGTGMAGMGSPSTMMAGGLQGGYRNTSGTMMGGGMQSGYRNTSSTMMRGGLQGGSANTAPIPTQFVSAIESRPADAGKFSTSLPERLARLPELHWNSPGQTEIRGRTLILRGTVATDHDRQLAERVARLEPGVDQVQNQLVVASHPAKPAN